MTSANPNT